MEMKIAELRIVNDSLQTNTGEIKAPTVFYMDIEEKSSHEKFSIPIDQTTYVALTDLFADRKPLIPGDFDHVN